MTRNCSICDHPRRRDIDRSLIEGQSCRAVATAHGVDFRAVDRHRRNHLPIAIRQAAQQAVQRADAAQTVTDTTIAPAPVCEAIEAVPAPVRTRQRTRGIQLSDSPPAPPPSPATPSAGNTLAFPGQAAPAGVLNVYEQSIGLRDRAMALLEAAEAAGDIKAALTAIRESRGVLEHLSRLEERQGGNAAAVPLVDSPEWTRTRAAIITALADHPEARLAVAEALISMGAM